MIYYTSAGRIVKYIKNKQDIISYGIQGVVYHFKNDECIKLYYNDCESRISKDMFLLYKELNLDNYCKLYDLLFNDKNIIIGYIMKYYQSSKENILFMPTEYTIDNVFRLYNSLTILANNGVLARDLHCGNAIVGDSEINRFNIRVISRWIKENMY